MKSFKSFVVLLVLLQMTLVLPFPFGAILEVISGAIIEIGGDYLKDLISPSSSPPTTTPGPSNAPNEAQIAALKELQAINEDMDTVIQEIVNFKEELISYLEQTELNNLFLEITALWNECRDILLTKEAGGFESEEQFQEKFQDFREKMKEIFLIVEKIRFEKAEWYLEKIRGKLIESRVDFITYQAKLTLGIKNYVLQSSRVICLLNLVLNSDPQFKNSIARLSDDLKKFEQYHQKYVLGSWFNLTQHILSEEGDIYYRDKTLELFSSKFHLYWHPGSLGASKAGITSLRASAAPGADIDDFPLFFEFLIDGVWKKLCANGEPLTVKFDCGDPEQQKWKPTPCPNQVNANEAALNFLCINHVATGLTLTSVPLAENVGSIVALQEFNPVNYDQLFSWTEARRCCEIYSSPSFAGNSTKICLGINQGYQEDAALSAPFSSVRCEAEIRLVAFEGKHLSKRMHVVEAGTEANFVDPSQATAMLGYYVSCTCSRIFSEKNLTGDYRTICGDIPNLQEQFVGKDVSLLLVQPLELFDGIDFTGNSIIIRRPMMNLEDWPFEVRSIRVLQY